MVNKIPWFSIATVCWLVTLLAGTLLPLNKLPDVATSVSDKLMHAVIFFILTILSFMAVRKENFLTIPDGKKYLYVTPFVLLIAIGTEYLQNFVPGRMSDLYDFIANISGALLGVLIFMLLSYKK